MNFIEYLFGKNETPTLEGVFSQYFAHSTAQENDLNQREASLETVEPMVELVRVFRPYDAENVEIVDIRSLLELLRSQEMYRINLEQYVKAVLREKKFSRLLTDSGIMVETGIFREMQRASFAYILPEQPEKNTLDYVLGQVFFGDNDPIWLQKIPTQQVEELLALLRLDPYFEKINDAWVLDDIAFALEVLSNRICGSALEQEVIQMVPEFENFKSPFISLRQEIGLLNVVILDPENPSVKPDDLALKQVFVMLQQCQDYVRTAFGNSSKFGISLSTNQKLLRIRQQLERLEVLLQLVQCNREDGKATSAVRLGNLLIGLNCERPNLKQFFGHSTQLLAYEITQHTANTGEHYITESKKEYWNMLQAALGGGLIVGLLCIFKLLISKLYLSDFGYALLYGLNYGFGFIAIYLLGFTLATKQPAMTAAALVRSLQQGLKSEEDEETKHSNFAHLFARLFRSQFIAFVGNVFMAFPVAMLGTLAVQFLFDYNMGAGKWEKLLTDLSPVHSLAFFHAAIAGIYLFLSGLLAGYIANRNKHYKLYERILEHPLLRLSLGKDRLKRFADFYQVKWAGIVSNFWFGMALGSTASIGAFLGLKLDIRHITFAAGNMALGWHGSEFSATVNTLIWAVLGIGLIGLVNFFVSFALSLGLAFRSRNIPVGEVKPIIRSVWHHFKTNPRSFFLP